ncbi:transposable element Tc1 transposase, putative [Talaromyces stipitatus ATCC 10500]|uniref:Transposable element Tc1 transposase, putative n=1 Tax=Talaromyces stipitatus (strain ATCC 10500 / CBS 375.48 / QM 6759 / NRRL 1006) TaxID=441959 RepID=B8MN47_TALSN|nr:transposable element Tc1 transposase, putative [Talaromyces stipitatus ATCC 10500]EED14496.1 transposable element Tc1 transposase, putative [Talaromyces stipitatus ATCC 10500]
MDEIIAWISQSKKNRRMPYHKVIRALNLSVSPTTLAYTLRKRGYTRCKALRKPDLSPEHRRQRLIWALEHVNWTIEQWNKILWTDETWVTSECHTRIYVTRTTGEEYDDTCLRSRRQRYWGWMFWGSIHGNTKGPCLFWEKEWGTIKAETYCQRTVPIIDGYLRLLRSEGLQSMQDGAPGHSGAFTREELHSRVWDWMKSWIDERYPEDDELSYDLLRQAVRAAWDAVPDSFLAKLIDGMQARCQAVIDAEGGPIPY